MIIYKEKLITNRRKSEINRALAEKLISKQDRSKLYIFPFSLFSLSFWKDFKRSRNVLFNGENNGQSFELKTEHLIFSNRSSLPLTITGKIEENEIRLAYSIPWYAILLIIGFMSAVYFLGKRSKMDIETSSFVMGIVFVLMYIIKVVRIHNTFKKICN